MDLLKNNPTMYLPTLISLSPVFESLDAAFHDLGLNISLIVGELLKEVLSSNQGKFGRHGHGPEAAFSHQLPEQYVRNLAFEKEQIHKAHLILVDILADVVPSRVQMSTYPFKFSGDEYFIIWLPMDPSTCPPELRRKLVPYGAVRHFDQ